MRRWEAYPLAKEMPTLQEYIQCLNERARIIKTTQTCRTPPAASGQPKVNLHIHKQTNTCVLCKKQHRIFSCDMFAAFRISERREHVKKNNLCLNCLGNHRVANCTSKSTCKLCGKKHNTLLHHDSDSNIAEWSDRVAAHTKINCKEERSTSILRTALLCIRLQSGEGTVGSCLLIQLPLTHKLQT